MSKIETEQRDGLTYNIIKSPFIGVKSFVQPIITGTLSGALLLCAASAVSASIWEDEQDDTEEVVEGIELYDERAETVASSEGEFISIRSIASPDLFDNIGDGSFPVEWDVYIEPVEGVSDNERINVSMYYDSNIDVIVSVERCESRYPAPPNYQGDEGRSCSGQTDTWEDVGIFASGYIGNLTGLEPIGDFMLQNGAYLRFTITPSGDVSETQIGDVIDVLEVHAEGFDERVIVGHTSDNARVESTVETSATEEEESSDENETLDVENEPIVEPTEEPTESPSVDIEENENVDEQVLEEDYNESSEDGIPMSWIIAGILTVLIGGVAAFFLLRKRGKEDIEDEYLDDDDNDDDDSEDYSSYSRSFKSF